MGTKETASGQLEYLNPQDIILADSRLDQARIVADSFFAQNRFDLPSAHLTERDFSRIADHTNALQDTIASAVFPGLKGHRQIQADQLTAVEKFFHRQAGLPVVAVMRHGDHQHTATPSTTPEEKAWFNVRRLQPPYNREDPETDTSVIESFGTAAALLLLVSAKGYSVFTEVTASRRGQQPGAILSSLSQSQLIHRSVWDCINYVENAEPGKNGLNPDGTLPWTPDTVNANCDISYDDLAAGTDLGIGSGLAKPDHHLTIGITHTQQADRAKERAGLGKVKNRIEPLAFVLLSTREGMLFPNGVYSGKE